jgi:hypothetical protein
MDAAGPSHATQRGGSQNELSPYEANSTLCFKQLGLSILGRKLP